MVILYKRRHPHKKNAGIEAAKGETKTTDCPNCGNIAMLIELQKDRATYKCSKCGTINTFVQSPAQIKKKEQHEKKHSPIVIRDKSKKESKPKKENENIDEDKVTNNMQSIRKGLKKNKVLNFEYRDANGNKTTRNIEGYKLTRDRRGHIVLYGYCLEAEGIRVFKLNSMKKIKVLSYQFEPRWPVEDELRKPNK